MVSKKKDNNKSTPIPKDKKDTSIQYQKTTMIISIFSIITSTLIGILTILNSNSITKLNNELSTPKLTYFIGQQFPGKVFLQINNSGKATAEDITVDINLNSEYLLANCTISPPFQDAQQIKILDDRHVAYKISKLAVESFIIFTCDFLKPYNVVGIDKETQEFQVLKFYDEKDIKKWGEINVDLNDDLIIQIFSANSQRATEIGTRPKVIALRADDITEATYSETSKKYTITMMDISIMQLGGSDSLPHSTPTP